MTNLWLDLELSEDIDDYITLLYAIESNKIISELSISNHTIDELKLFKYIINKYNLNIPIIFSGNIIYKETKKNIHISLLKLIYNIDIDIKKDLIHIDDYLKQNISFKNKIIFCGGSFTNLDIITKKYPNVSFNCYLQGGYAGESVVGKENVLDKFKNREKVPSWNPNINFEATKNILANKNIDIHFISKNVCHNSWLSNKDIDNKETELYRTLEEYFLNNKYSSKCMHDLVALCSIFDRSYIEFKNVDILYEEGKLVSWYSILNENSNIKISTSLNMDLFKIFLNKELNCI